MLRALKRAPHAGGDITRAYLLGGMVVEVKPLFHFDSSCCCTIVLFFVPLLIYWLGGGGGR